MDFENSLAFSGSNLCLWSPNGRYLAVVSAKNRLVLRDAASLEVLRTEVIVSGGPNYKDDSIDTIIFSPDSQFILASDFKNGVTFVYKTGADKDSSTWKAKITEGLSGMIEYNIHRLTHISRYLCILLGTYLLPFKTCVHANLRITYVSML